MVVEQTETRAQKSNYGTLSFFIIVLFLIVIFVSLLIHYGNFEDDFDNSDTKFSQIKKSLLNGNKLRLVLDYGKMNLYENGIKVQSPKYIGGFDLENFEFYQNQVEFISAFHSFTSKNQKFGLVYTNRQLNIYENDTVELLVNIFSNNNNLITSQLFNSTLSKGSVLLFNQTPYKKKGYDKLANRKKSIFEKYFN